jgi:hypothetical protein
VTDEPADDPPNAGSARDAEPGPAPEKVERWRLEAGGRRHLITLTQLTTFKRSIVWTVDGDDVASKETSEDSVTLGSEAEPAVVKLKISGWSDSARRVRLFTGATSAAAHAAAVSRLGGDDFLPDPGTKAARRQERMAAHPWRYTLLRTISAIAGIVVPIAVIWLLTRLFGGVDLPDVDLPDVPWPDVDLPEIPFPDITLPSVDLPEMPAWMRTVAKYVVPVAVAFFVARREVKRRAAAERDRRDAADRDRRDAAHHAAHRPAHLDADATDANDADDAAAAERERATTSGDD